VARRHGSEAEAADPCVGEAGVAVTGARVHHETAMTLADLARYTKDLSPEQRRAYSAQAAGYELRALAASAGDTELTQAVLARSACWLLIDAGDPCRALKLARWALSLGPPADIRAELSKVLAEGSRRSVIPVDNNIRRRNSARSS
jgi:hypothetical protein